MSSRHRGWTNRGNAEKWIYFIVVQSLRHIQLFAAPWATACQASLSSNISQFAVVHSGHCVGDAI